jgi:hypothetical protein
MVPSLRSSDVRAKGSVWEIEDAPYPATRPTRLIRNSALRSRRVNDDVAGLLDLTLSVPPFRRNRVDGDRRLPG